MIGRNGNNVQTDKGEMNMRWFRNCYRHLTDQQIWELLKKDEIYILCKALWKNDRNIDSWTICKIFVEQFDLSLSQKQVLCDERVGYALQKWERDDVMKD